MTEENLEWLSNILALAERIANGSLEADWIKECLNPALSVGMLKAEVFQTLLSDEARWVMRRQFLAAPSLVEALELFLHCLRNVSVTAATDRPKLYTHLFSRRNWQMRVFLTSQHWLELRERAVEVSSAAREAGH